MSEDIGYAPDASSIFATALAGEPAEATASEDAKGEAPAESVLPDEVNLSEGKPKEPTNETAPDPNVGKDVAPGTESLDDIKTPEQLSKLLAAHRYTPQEVKELKGLFYSRNEYQRIMPINEAREIRNLAPTLEDVRYGAEAAEKIGQFTRDFIQNPREFAENLKATDERAYAAFVREITPEITQLDPGARQAQDREAFETTVLGLADSDKGAVYHVLATIHGPEKAGELTPGVQEAAQFLRDALVVGRSPSAPGLKDPRAEDISRREREFANQQQQHQQQYQSHFVQQTSNHLIAATEAAIRQEIGTDFSPELAEKIVKEVANLTAADAARVPANERAYEEMLNAAMRGDSRITPAVIVRELQRRVQPILRKHAVDVKSFYAKQLVGANQEKRRQSDAVSSRRDIGSGVSAGGSGKSVEPTSAGKSAKDIFSAALGL